MLVGTESGHVHTDLGDDALSGELRDSWDGIYSSGCITKGSECIADLPVKTLHLPLDVDDKVQVKSEKLPVMGSYPSVKGLDQPLAFDLQATSGEIGEAVRVRLALDQGVKNGAPADSEDVADEARNLEVGVVESLLDPLGVLCDLSNQLLSRSGEIPKVLDGGGGNEASPD